MFLFSNLLVVVIIFLFESKEEIYKELVLVNVIIGGILGGIIFFVIILLFVYCKRGKNDSVINKYVDKVKFMESERVKYFIYVIMNLYFLYMYFYKCVIW